jgi:hypothetical protein
MRNFITWETSNIAVNPAWLNLMALTAEFPQSRRQRPQAHAAGTITLLPGATHHSIPTEHPAEINRHLLQFLA